MEALAGALQKVTVDGGEMEMAAVEESLSASERGVVSRLRELQQQHAQLAAAFDAAVLQLKMEYEEKYKPLYEKRLEALTAATGGEEPSGDKTTGTPGLPSFWLRALKANRLLADMIESADEEPLSYLKNIECVWLGPGACSGSTPTAPPTSTSSTEEAEPHPESFRLVFTFSENPFFKPLVLIKEYHLSVAPGGRGAELTKTRSTQIDWYPDKNVTKKVLLRNQRNRKTKQTRTIAETVDASSFFNIFVDHDIPSDEKLEQMNDKQVHELQMVVEADYDVGITIRDKIIPRAVEWFLGQVDDDSDFDDFDYNDEDYSSSLDSSEDLSEDETPPPQKNKNQSANNSRFRH